MTSIRRVLYPLPLLLLDRFLFFFDLDFPSIPEAFRESKSPLLFPRTLMPPTWEIWSILSQDPKQILPSCAMMAPQAPFPPLPPSLATPKSIPSPFKLLKAFWGGHRLEQVRDSLYFFCLPLLVAPPPDSLKTLESFLEPKTRFLALPCFCAAGLSQGAESLTDLPFSVPSEKGKADPVFLPFPSYKFV